MEARSGWRGAPQGQWRSALASPSGSRAGAKLEPRVLAGWAWEVSRTRALPFLCGYGARRLIRTVPCALSLLDKPVPRGTRPPGACPALLRAMTPDRKGWMRSARSGCCGGDGPLPLVQGGGSGRREGLSPEVPSAPWSARRAAGPRSSLIVGSQPACTLRETEGGTGGGLRGTGVLNAFNELLWLQSHIPSLRRHAGDGRAPGTTQSPLWEFPGVSLQAVSVEAIEVAEDWQCALSH